MNHTDLERAVINPRRGRKEEPVAPRLLMTFTRPDYQSACHLAAAPAQERIIFDCPIRAGCWQEHPITLAGPALGAPYAVMVLEKLIALGVQAVVALGWCGSLNPEVKIGDLVIPESAHCEEGTSGHYPLNEQEPQPAAELCRALRSLLTSAGVTFHSGKVWTTDAIFRETEAKVLAYGSSQGMLAVEMEMSALFTVARFRGVALAGLLIVSDELFTLTWRHGLRDNRFQHSRQLAVTVALDALIEFKKFGSF